MRWNGALLRRLIPGSVVLAMLVALASCGDSPTEPGPIVPPPPPPAANQVPVIESVTVSAERVEAETDVTVTANVRDAETPVDQLRFDWSADAGAFSGTGPVVRWRLPRGATTPADHQLRLTVVETYGTAPAGGSRPQHTVSGASPAVRVHDSSKEIGDLALRFLRDFATSDVTPDIALREFSDTCSGKEAERDDLEANRRNFDVLSSQLMLVNAAVTSPWDEGVATVQCRFSSRRLNCPPGSTSCTVGAVETVQGNCNLTTKYEQQRWLLCTSTFSSPTQLNVRGFFGKDR